jgi:hypothetical protein
MEAELCAATEASKELLHITNVANDLLIDVPKGIPLFENVQSAINLCLRTGITKRSRHIEAKWFFCRDLAGNPNFPGKGVLKLVYKCAK